MSDIFNPIPGGSYDKTGALISVPAAENPQAVEPVVPVATADQIPTVEANVDAVSTAASGAPAEPDWTTILQEKTGGKFKSWEDITSKLTEIPAEPSYANDESRRVAQLLQEGKVDDVLQVYNEQRRLSNLKGMSDAEAIRLAMEYKSPAFDADEVKDEFESKYSLGEKPTPPDADDYVGDDDYAKAQKAYEKELRSYEKAEKALTRSLKRDASEAREYLESLKKDIVLPEIKTTSTTQQQDPAELETAMADWRKWREEYTTSLNKSSADFKEIPFKITDEGFSFEGSYQIDDAEKAQLSKDLAEKDVANDLFLSRYVKEDGYDTKKLMEDLYFLSNKEKIMASAIKQAFAKAKLDGVMELKNVDLSGQHRSDPGLSKEAALSDMASAFFKAR